MRHSSRLKVNLGNLSHNFSELKILAPKNNIIFMVKSEAYGHGLVPIVKFAFQELGVKSFGCASLGEACFIRKELPEIQSEIFVFSDNEIENDELGKLYSEMALIPVLHSLEQVRKFVSTPSYRYVPLTLKFNTGMNRLGILPSEVDELTKILKASGRKTIYHVMSHLSSSYLPLKNNDRNNQQKETFLSILSSLKNAGLDFEHSSLSNSGGIEQKFGLDEFDYIRPGLMLYGPQSLPHKEKTNWRFKCLSSLESKILDVRSIKKGEPIGYGATPCPDNGCLVIIPLGYGDGILTSYSKVKIKTAYGEAQIVGRINMDLTYLLFPLNVSKELKVGLPLKVWDEDPRNIESIALQMGTIPYQLYCAISIRVPRIYSLE